MPIYDIKKENVEAHMDLEKDIRFKKNGLLTFTIKVNQGNITDYIYLDYADYGKPNSSCNS